MPTVTVLSFPYFQFHYLYYALNRSMRNVSIKPFRQFNYQLIFLRPRALRSTCAANSRHSFTYNAVKTANWTTQLLIGEERILAVHHICHPIIWRSADVTPWWRQRRTSRLAGTDHHSASRRLSQSRLRRISRHKSTGRRNSDVLAKFYIINFNKYGTLGGNS